MRPMLKGKIMTQLLRIPHTFHTVEEVLETAKHLNLPNVLVLSELEDGKLVFLETTMSVANANWLLDRMKALLVTPSVFERKEP
jgi:hypothetical protein